MKPEKMTITKSDIGEMPDALLDSIMPNKAQHSPLLWRLEIGEGACFHTGNRVSIVHDYTDGDEKCLSTVAEVWSTDGDQDIADGKLIVCAVNTHAEALLMAEALRTIRDRNNEFSPDYQTANEALIKWERANQ